tara:strand:- start:734 stop:949 length:216 start_codon:yes stop_codon:yes gene_type:complete
MALRDKLPHFSIICGRLFSNHPSGILKKVIDCPFETCGQPFEQVTIRLVDDYHCPFCGGDFNYNRKDKTYK